MGVMPIGDALHEARIRELDLVEVAPQADPPVCRLLDYGKYIYERAKRERKARRAQRAKSADIKEIRLRPKTGEHDLAYKCRDIRRFLNDGCKVKVRVRFRGREITHPQIGKELLDKIAGELEDVGTVVQTPRMEGRSMLMVLSPERGKKKT